MFMRFALLFLSFVLSAEVTTSGGKKVFYLNKGSGPSTILLIHGWACDHTFLDPQFEEFSKSARVLSMDLPGHGQSEAPAKMDIDSFVASVEAVRASANSQQLILVGHSMGALVAREYARRFPKRSRAMVFLDGSIFQLPPGEADRARWAEGIARMAHGFGPSNEKQTRERSISVFLSNMYTDETPRELRMSVMRKILATAPETAEGAMMTMTDMRLWVEDKIDLPVLALRAGRLQPPNEEPFLKSMFPRLQYKFMPGLSHFLMLENPARVNEEIRSFLKGSKL